MRSVSCLRERRVVSKTKLKKIDNKKHECHASAVKKHNTKSGAERGRSNQEERKPRSILGQKRQNYRAYPCTVHHKAYKRDSVGGMQS